GGDADGGDAHVDDLDRRVLVRLAVDRGVAGVERLRDLPRGIGRAQIHVRQVYGNFERLAQIAHVGALGDALLLHVDVLRSVPGRSALFQLGKRRADVGELL